MTISTKIKFSNINSIFVCSTQQSRYLLVKKELGLVNFLLITSEITSIRVLGNSELVVNSTTNDSTFLNFLLRLKNSCLILKKKLILKGLGFKIIYFEETKTLSFKLGYSHLAFINIPVGINLVKIGKNYLIVSGVEPFLLGNFITSIQRLRFPDVYKGKGFWKKYEKKALKLFKKK